MSNPITTKINRDRFVSLNGQTQFTYTFWTPDDVRSRDIRIRVNNAIVTTGFRINLVSKVVTFTTGRTTGDIVEVIRILRKVRNNNFRANTRIETTALNEALNKIYAYGQDEQFKNERFTIQFTLPVGYNRSFTILGDAYVGFTIDQIVCQTRSGTIEATLNVNGAVFADMEDFEISGSKETIQADLDIDPTDRITVDLAENDDAMNVSITLQCSKVI